MDTFLRRRIRPHGTRPARPKDQLRKVRHSHRSRRRHGRPVSRGEPPEPAFRRGHLRKRLPRRAAHVRGTVGGAGTPTGRRAAVRLERADQHLREPRAAHPSAQDQPVHRRVRGPQHPRTVLGRPVHARPRGLEHRDAAPRLQGKGAAASQSGESREGTHEEPPGTRRYPCRDHHVDRALELLRRPRRRPHRRAAQRRPRQVPATSPAQQGPSARRVVQK